MHTCTQQLLIFEQKLFRHCLKQKSVKMYLIIICAAVFAVVAYLIQKLFEIKNVPPGPIGLPIVGYLPYLAGKDITDALTEIGKKYGSIFSLRLGDKLVIVINDHKAMKEAVIKQGDIFSGRPHDLFLFTWINKGRGMVASDGHKWKTIRRFTLSVLKDLGFGRKSMEYKIQDEVAHLNVEFAKQGPRFNTLSLLMKATSNVVCSVVFGERYDYDDPNFVAFVDVVNRTLTTKFAGSVINFLPWLKHLPSIKKDLGEKRKLADENHLLLNKLIDDCLRKMESDSSGEVTSLLEALSRETKGQSEQAKILSESSMFLINNLFIAGSDTTAVTTEWAILMCILHPEMQEKIHLEIDSVIGRERIPSLKDRQFMPYTEAFLLEIQRFCSLIPLSLPHSNMEETNVLGYRIPKRCLVLLNLRNMHSDPTYWPNPEEFRPERFLTPSGGVDYKLPSFFPFSAGKRICAGETLAKMELFHFFVGILQKWKIKNPEGEAMPSSESVTDGVAAHPMPFDASFELR